MLVVLRLILVHYIAFEDPDGIIMELIETIITGE